MSYLSTKYSIEAAISYLLSKQKITKEESYNLWDKYVRPICLGNTDTLKALGIKITRKHIST